MNSTLSINSLTFTPLNPTLPTLRNSSTPQTRSLTTSLSKFQFKAILTNPTKPNLSISPLKATISALIFSVALFGTHSKSPANAEIPPLTVTEELPENEETQLKQETIQESPLTHLLSTSSETIDALKNLLQEKLEAGEDEQSLSVLKKLASAQPDNLEWKFMIARVLNELGRIEEARDAFEEILAKNPLSFEALFENALLMDKSGERDAVMRRLEDALRVAESESKVKESRDVKLIIAQMQFLQKNVEEALRSYEELVAEDPNDFRPYFCKGMIFSLMDKNVEAREQFAKYKELSPKKFEVEGYLRSSLSRMKLFGMGEEN